MCTSKELCGKVFKIASKLSGTYKIYSDNGSASLAVDVPDTITSWVAGAFAMSKTTGLGIASEKAKVSVFLVFTVRVLFTTLVSLVVNVISDQKAPNFLLHLYILNVVYLNYLPKDKILDWFKLKALAKNN